MLLKDLITTRLEYLSVSPTQAAGAAQEAGHKLTKFRLSQLMGDEPLVEPLKKSTYLALAYVLRVGVKTVLLASFHSIGVEIDDATVCDRASSDGQQLMIKIRNDRTPAQRVVLLQVAQAAVDQGQELQDRMALRDGQSEAG